MEPKKVPLENSMWAKIALEAHSHSRETHTLNYGPTLKMAKEKFPFPSPPARAPGSVVKEARREYNPLLEMPCF